MKIHFSKCSLYAFVLVFEVLGGPMCMSHPITWHGTGT